MTYYWGRYLTSLTLPYNYLDSHSQLADTSSQEGNMEPTGKQFEENPYGECYTEVSHDQNGNEIPIPNGPVPENTTAGETGHGDKQYD